MLSGTKFPSKTQSQPVFKMLFASYQRFYPRYRRNSAALDKLVSIANQQVGKTEQQCDSFRVLLQTSIPCLRVMEHAFYITKRMLNLGSDTCLRFFFNRLNTLWQKRFPLTWTHSDMPGDLSIFMLLAFVDALITCISPKI